MNCIYCNKSLKEITFGRHPTFMVNCNCFYQRIVIINDEIIEYDIDLPIMTIKGIKSSNSSKLRSCNQTYDFNFFPIELNLKSIQTLAQKLYKMKNFR